MIAMTTLHDINTFKVGLTEQTTRTQQNNCANGFHSLVVLYLFPISNIKDTDVMMFTITTAEDVPVKCRAYTFTISFKVANMAATALHRANG
jgi:hypothetical protein